MAALVLAAVVLLLTSLAAAASLRLVSSVSFALASYLLAVGEVVLLTELLSFGHWVGRTGYAIGEALLLALSLAVWLARGRPLPPSFSLDRLALARHPVVTLLAVVVAAAICYQAFLVFATPPNTWDSMTYHLARTAEWYQRHAVEYYPAHTARENAYQPNAEMLILYSLAFIGRDTVAALPQLLAELASLGAVFGIARRLGFARPAAAFAALLTATLTEVALQSVTTQNDLLAASFLAAALYFLLGRERKELALAGLAVGLALGTKATSAFGLPLIVLAALIVLDRRRLLQALGFALAGIALAGAYGYALNLAETGRSQGDSAATAPLRAEWTPASTASTLGRLAYRLVDLSGYHSAKVKTSFTFRVNTLASEDVSYFGPLGVLVAILAAGFAIAVTAGRAPPKLLAPALAVPVYLVAIAVSNRYNVFLGRFLLAGVVLTMPLAAWLYRSRALAAAAAMVGALTLALAHAYNQAKPTGLDGTPVWSLQRARAQAILRPEMTGVIRGVDRFVPTNARLGFALGEDDWIYPLYGPHLRRTLVRLPRVGLLVAANRAELEWVVIRGDVPIRVGWTVTRLPARGWTLLERA